MPRRRRPRRPGRRRRPGRAHAVIQPAGWAGQVGASVATRPSTRPSKPGRARPRRPSPAPGRRSSSGHEPAGTVSPRSSDPGGGRHHRLGEDQRRGRGGDGDALHREGVQPEAGHAEERTARRPARRAQGAVRGAEGAGAEGGPRCRRQPPSSPSRRAAQHALGAVGEVAEPQDRHQADVEGDHERRVVAAGCRPRRRATASSAMPTPVATIAAQSTRVSRSRIVAARDHARSRGARPRCRPGPGRAG